MRPLIKKEGLEPVFSNYRPVSNLSFISKVLEKVVLQQFTEHCDKNLLMPDYQSAYRKNFSCETAVIKIVNDVLCNMESQKLTALAAIDLSAAFDTVDHHVLLKVLQFRFGVTGLALNWFKNYLSPRGFKVCINTSYSKVRDISYSVPQGSINGPSLYSCYASTIKEVIPRNTDIHGYADDHAIKKSFIPSTELDTILDLQKTLQSVKKWMDANRLKMNNSKTEFIIFGSKSNQKKSIAQNLVVNDCNIPKSPVIKYLGVFLDELLSFKQQILSKCKTANYNLYLLRQIRKFLTMDAAKVIALGMVISHLDYCNSLLVGLPQSEIKKLQRIQNITAKVVLHRKKYSSSTQALKELHWLPIHLRIKYKLCIIMFNCKNGECPKYLLDLVEKKQTQREGLRSNSYSCVNYNVPFCKLSSFQERSFSVQGPKCWNELPYSLKIIDSFNMFKKSLKTHLFTKF